MNKVIKIVPFILIGFLYVGCQSNAQQLNNKDTRQAVCNERDTFYRIMFSMDTSTADFYKMLRFIESKGEFSRFDKKHKMDSSTKKNLLLQKVLCQEQSDFGSPMEKCLLDSVFCIRYYLTSKKPVKGTTDYFPKFDITQYNFKTAAEKDKAYQKIKEIGMGDPRKKWNDYYIVVSETRIIELRSYVTMFGETKDRYGKLLQDWIDKERH
jgi:hypothetical protein